MIPLEREFGEMVGKFFFGLFMVGIGFVVIELLLHNENTKQISKDENVKYLTTLPDEKKLEILKLCYTAYGLNNCDAAVSDYQKIAKVTEENLTKGEK